MTGQVKSKWLRGDGDDEWESRFGKSNNIPKSRGFGATAVNEENIHGGDKRDEIFRGKDRAIIIDSLFQNSKVIPQGANSVNMIGPGTEELVGLAILDKKRRREGNIAHEVYDIDDGAQINVYNNSEFYNTDATLSAMDCVASSPTDLAMLAKQASHSQ